MEDYNNIKWNDDVLTDLDEFLPSANLQETYLSRALAGEFSVEEVRGSYRKQKEQKERQPKSFSYAGSKHQSVIKVRSRFSCVEHPRLLRALKIITAGRTNLNYFDKQDMELYNNSKVVLRQENDEFLNYAKMNWENTFGRYPLRIRPSILQYAICKRGMQVKSVFEYPQNYKAIDLVSYSYTDQEAPVEMLHVSNALDVGKVAKFHPPFLDQSSCKLSICSLPSLDKHFNSQLTVSKDKNIDAILAREDIDIVISLSGLRRLIDFTDLNQMWHMPVVIKEIKKPRSNGSVEVKKVIFIDKPLPKLKINQVELNEKCTKQMMKTNFCKFVGFTYPQEDILINPDKVEDLENVEYEDSTSEDEAPSESGASKLTQKRRVCHNAFYKVWSLGERQDGGSVLMKKHYQTKTFKVLVRGKLDACEASMEHGFLLPVTVVPKMEYHLNFGGHVSTQSELASQWTSLYFKPRSILYKVRTHYSRNEVIKVEQSNLNMVSVEAATRYNYKPHAGLGILYKMAHQLKTCPPGNYMLHHEQKLGAFMSLLQETREKDGVHDLHELYSNEYKVITDYKKPWCPIDVNVILPMHEYLDRMPGLFTPRAIQKQVFKKHPKKKKKKGKAGPKMDADLEKISMEF